jgi:hypothetical protein
VNKKIDSVYKKILFPFRTNRKIKDHLGVSSLHWSLLNLKACGFDPSFTIDIGAYVGEWTEQFFEIFPGKKVLMVEAQDSKKTYLEKVSSQYNCVNYLIGLLSATKGSPVSFYENERQAMLSYRMVINLLKLKYTFLKL